MAAGKNTIVKDSDGHIIETGLFDMIESKGLKVTYDSQGNLIIVKDPKLKTYVKMSYQVMMTNQLLLRKNLKRK